MEAIADKVKRIDKDEGARDKNVIGLVKPQVLLSQKAISWSRSTYCFWLVLSCFRLKALFIFAIH